MAGPGGGRRNARGPLITGHNRDEFRRFIALAGQLGKIGDDEAALALRVFGPGPDAEQAYREAFRDASALYELVQSDWLFRVPVLHLAEAQVAGGGRAHVYELTWAAPGADGVMGACHGLDETLVFGTFDAHLGPMLLGPEPPPDEVALSARFRRTWATFDTNGDPGWYDSQRRLVQIFDSEPLVTAYPKEASRRLWRDYTFPALPLLGA